MAAKVLLGVVALAAVVGSPFAYNHFKSPSGETQKEVEAKNEQPGTAEKPANAAPEAKAVVPEAKAQNPEQNGDGQGPSENGGAKGPVTDPCNLEGKTSWDSTGGVLSDQSQCVRGEVLTRRDQN